MSNEKHCNWNYKQTFLRLGFDWLITGPLNEAWKESVLINYFKGYYHINPVYTFRAINPTEWYKP